MLLILAGCGDEDIQPSNNYANLCANPSAGGLLGTVQDENNWIRSWSHETYLWYEELPNIDPAEENNPVAYFNRMKTNAITASGKPKDRFHFTQNTANYINYREGEFYFTDTNEHKLFSELGFSTGYGFKVLVTKDSPRKLFVIYTEPESPAFGEIERGDQITAIDEINLESSNSENFNKALQIILASKAGDVHSFIIKKPNEDYKLEIILASQQTTEKPVHKIAIIQQDNKKVGYLLLNTFGVATAEQQLIEAVKEFEKSEIDELVLDLRYNGGGYLSISSQLAAMIAGSNSLEKIYGKVIHNDKRTFRNHSELFPTSAYGFSATKDTKLPMLNLNRVYVLVTENTASASEFLINSLRGINIEVILIGETTTGKPYGFIPQNNCGITYFTIQFKGLNNNGFGDYADGFTPAEVDNGTEVRGCKVSDDISQPLGNPQEKMLANALHYIKNQECLSNSLQANDGENSQLSKIRGKVLRKHPAVMTLP